MGQQQGVRADTSRSRNLTVENSPGYVRTNDPSYTSLPHDSRKPPAPVDPASPSIHFSRVLYAHTFRFSFQVVLHLLCAGLNLWWQTTVKRAEIGLLIHMPLPA